MYRPYDNAQTVDDAGAVLADFVRRGERVYQAFEHQSDIVYGSRPRSTLDLFDLSDGIGTVVFIHGGYWQSCVKSDFACIVPPVLEQGYRCVLLEYDLAPNSRISEIVRQVGDALDFLQEQAWARTDIVLMGHSAGAHLAACHMSHPVVAAVHLLSGIYDLAPIRQTHLNAALQLSDAEILNHSPAYLPLNATVPCHIAFGAKELPELKWQSMNFFQRRHLAGHDGPLVCQQLPACDHFNILDAYCAQRRDCLR